MAGFLSSLRPSIPAFSRRALRFVTFAACLAVAGMLAGCAAQMAFYGGKSLIEEGKVEDGLVKLHEAVEQDPRNLEYRKTYIQARDHALLAAGGRHVQEA